MSETTGAGARRRKSSLWKVLGAFGALALLVIVILLVFAPAIISRFAPGMVRDAARESVAGGVTVDKVALTWRGPQRISGLKVTDPSGAKVADISLEASTSLLAVLRGSRDLGTIKLSGDVVVEKGRDGQTTLARAIEPPPGAPGQGTSGAPGATPPSGGPSTIPPELAAKLIVDGLTVTYRDASGNAISEVTMPNLRGEASLKTGEPIRVTLDGAGSVDGQPTALKLNASVEQWSTPDGRATPELAKVDAVADISAPGGLVAAFASMPGVPAQARALGEEWAGDAKSLVSLQASAKGDANQLTVDVKAAMTGAQADLGLVLTGLTGANPSVTTTRAANLRATLSPTLIQRLAPDAGLALDAPVTIDASFQGTSPIPTGGALDLRGASLSASATLSEISGTAQVQGEPRPRAITVAPTTVEMNAATIEQGVSLAVRTSAMVDGENAGNINVDLTGEGVLDEQGAPRAPRALRGSAAITGLSTALAQPFVTDAGLLLREDVGPTIDLTLNANPRSAPSGASPSGANLPPTDIVLSLRSNNLRADGSLQLDGERVTTTAQGIRAMVADAAPLIRRVLAENGKLLGSTGPVSLAANVTNLEAPLPSAGKPFDLSALRAQLEAGVQGLSGVIENERIDVSNARLNATLAPGEPARATLSASAMHDGRAFGVDGDVALDNLFTPDGRLALSGARPVGTLTVRDLPVTLARLAGLADMLDLVRASVGETVALSVRATPSGSDASATNIALEATGANATATAQGVLHPDALEIKSGEATTRITPALVSEAVRRFAPDMPRPPQLAQPVGVRATLGPARIPLRDGKPDLAAAGAIGANLGFDAPLVLRGLDAGGGRTVDVSLDGVKASANVPLSGKGRIDATLDAGLFDPSRPAARPVGAISANATLTGEGEQRNIEGALRVQQLETAYVDALLGKPGLLALALGETANVSANAKPTTNSATTLTGTVDAPRLKAQFAGALHKDRVALTAPLNATWNVSEQWINRFALGADASTVTIIGDTPIDLRVDRAAIALNGGPLKPGVFDLAATANARALTIATADGQRVRIDAARATLASPAPGSLSVDAALTGVRGAAGDPGDATLKATLSNIADASGALTPDRATATASIDGAVPTALVDALAQQNGVLLEALGPTMTLRANADSLSREGGSLNARAVAPRAEARIRGDVRDGLFISAEPITATIHEITPELSRRMIESIFPLLTRMEKRRADGPAVATVTDLRLPTRKEIDTDGDGVPDKPDLRKLNADIRIELGRMSYTTNDLFSGVLKATKNKTEGQLFNRFPPIDVRVRDGVAQYDRTSFPIGEFTVETRGKVDLAKREMDLIVYIPLIGLADEAIGIFRAAPGFNDAAPVPFRMKGPIGKAVPIPAPDLMLKEAIKTPGKIIEDVGKGLEDLFKKRD
ncbi:MAG: hypothetical protein AB7G17_01340 [Phycisphaerales bacterium]